MGGEPAGLPFDLHVQPALAALSARRELSLKDPETYWRSVAADLWWGQQVGPVREDLPDPPFARWFPSWTTNLCANAVDRHVHAGRGNRVAYYWEGETGSQRTLSYAQLHREVNRWAIALRDLGVNRGDRVTLYLPLIPELPIAMLATAKLGAIHSVVFAGFAARALGERIDDSGSRIVVTADGGFRRGRLVPLKDTVDEAVKDHPAVGSVVVVRHAANEVPMRSGRDVWADDLTSRARGTVEPVAVEGPAPSFILYTSGTTGRPKGATHSTAGYMVWVHATERAVFALRDSDVYWCTADIGWITGHSYVVYAPLIAGASSVLYEGAPDFPSPDRWWSVIDRHRVTVLYTSPTAIRMHMKHGEAWTRGHDLTSLRLLGTVGEAINPPAWTWYHRHIGDGRLPIVDTWWQTETGGIMVSPQPGFATISLKPGSATVPLPGVQLSIRKEDGSPAATSEKGYVVLEKPWPGEFIGLWGDPERFRTTYFARFPGAYYTGDYGLVDSDGYVWFLGRADEVLKIAGHRIGTIEVEDALISYPAVAESAVVGKSDATRGQVAVAFVTLRPGHTEDPDLPRRIIDHVKSTIGPIAAPQEVYLVDRLPKTRSGKIMRRVMSAVVDGQPPGDITTIEDEASVDEIRRAYEELRSRVSRP